MKFITVSLSLILLMLCLCIFASNQVIGAVDETKELLEKAITVDGQTSLSAVQAASKVWKSHETFFGTVLRHDEIDDVLSDFARLESYAISRDREEFLANCAALIAQLEHIKDMERPTFQNIM